MIDSFMSNPLKVLTCTRKVEDVAGIVCVSQRRQYSAGIIGHVLDVIQ